MSVYLRRVAAAQATLDRFLGEPLEWGRTDCARIAAFCLRELGVPAPLSRFGRYTTPLGAQRALLRRGFGDLGAVVDDMGLARIPPAATLPGDLVGLRAGDLPLTLAVCLGGGRVLGHHSEAEGAVVIQPTSFLAAWSAL